MKPVFCGKHHNLELSRHLFKIKRIGHCVDVWFLFFFHMSWWYHDPEQ